MFSERWPSHVKHDTNIPAVNFGTQVESVTTRNNLLEHYLRRTRRCMQQTPAESVNAATISQHSTQYFWEELIDTFGDTRLTSLLDLIRITNMTMLLHGSNRHSAQQRLVSSQSDQLVNATSG